MGRKKQSKSNEVFDEYDDDIVRQLVEEYVVIRCGHSARSMINMIYNDPSKFKTFIKASQLCEALSCDPRLYIRAQKMFNEGEFFVNKVCTERAEEFLQRYREEVVLPNNLDDLFSMQVRYLTNALEFTNRSLENILLDNSIQFFPWFRIIITSEPNQKVIDAYGETAKNQMNERLKAFLQTKKYKDGRPFDLSRIPD